MGRKTARAKSKQDIKIQKYKQMTKWKSDKEMLHEKQVSLAPADTGVSQHKRQSPASE